MAGVDTEMKKSQVHARDLLHFILPGAFLPAGYLPRKLRDEIDITENIRSAFYVQKPSVYFI